MDQKKVDAQRIENTDDAVSFMLKYNKHPQLHDHQDKLLDLFTFLEQFSFHKYVGIEKEFCPKTGKRKYAREEYQQRIDSLNKLKNKIKKWYDRPVAKALQKFEKDIDDLVATFEDKKPEPMPGKGTTNQFKLLARTVKDFWIEALGHEKFIYDKNKPNDDWAVEFVNDLVMAVFAGSSIKQINRLPQAFKEISDPRT
jgi:hypothetical protein